MWRWSKEQPTPPSDAGAPGSTGGPGKEKKGGNRARCPWGSWIPAGYRSVRRPAQPRHQPPRLNASVSVGAGCGRQGAACLLTAGRYCPRGSGAVRSGDSPEGKERGTGCLRLPCFPSAARRGSEAAW